MVGGGERNQREIAHRGDGWELRVAGPVRTRLCEQGRADRENRSAPTIWV